jgi:DNA-binding protein YbaB
MDLQVLGSRPSDRRVSGSASGNEAHAVVDGTGRLVDLQLDGDLLRQPTVAVIEAVLAAVTDAQETASALAEQERAQRHEVADQQLATDLAQANREAERRLAELTTIVSDLIRHPESGR